jgi:hypothetical protein
MRDSCAPPAPPRWARARRGVASRALAPALALALGAAPGCLCAAPAAPGTDAADLLGPFIIDAGTPPAPVLAVAGETLQMGGMPMRPFGLRVAGALDDDPDVAGLEILEGLVAYLPTYRHFGVGAVAVGLQGGYGGTFTAYDAAGALTPEAQERLTTLLDATAAQGVAVAVMLFRAGRDGELADEAAVQAAAAGAAAFVSAWDHVWVDALDDVDADVPFTHDVLANPARHAEVLGWIRAAAPGLLAVAGTLGDLESGPGDTAAPLAGSGRPALVFPHPRLDDYDARGVYSAFEEDRARLDAGGTFAAGGYFFWHSAWSDHFPPNWYVGGDGSSTVPGLLWLFDDFRTLLFPMEGGGA